MFTLYNVRYWEYCIDFADNKKYPVSRHSTINMDSV